MLVFQSFFKIYFNCLDMKQCICYNCWLSHVVPVIRGQLRVEIKGAVAPYGGLVRLMLPLHAIFLIGFRIIRIACLVLLWTYWNIVHKWLAALKSLGYEKIVQCGKSVCTELRKCSYSKLICMTYQSNCWH